DGATLLGASTSPPYSAPLNSPLIGLHTLRAVSADSSGYRRTSGPVNITISAPQPLLTLVQTGSVWSYFCANTGAPNGWQNFGFNDATWSNGAARIGFNNGNTGLGTSINGGPSNDRFRAAYFRRPFTINDPGSITNLTLTLARDDGAVIYLNGVEILRDNFTNGFAPTYSMFA